MKKIMMILIAAFTAVVISGCCSGNKGCDAKAGCKQPCAKQTKCPLLGEWEFLISRDGKLLQLPVAPQPKLELCKKGVMRFHYAKNDKPAVLEGRWKVADGKLIVSDIKQTRVQAYTLQKDGTAEYTVGKNDRLPENTRVIIRKIK